jgi:hypothetical protein
MSSSMKGAVFLLVHFVSQAAFALNPRCIGTCEDDGTTLCGDRSECSQGACVFPESCYPGGAFAITGVVEEAVLGANDFSKYGSASISADSQDGELSWRNNLPTAVFAGPYTPGEGYVQALPVTAGKRYYFGAKVKVPAGGTAYFIPLFNNGDGSSYSDYAMGPPQGSSDWQHIGVVLTPQNATQYYLQLYGYDRTGAGQIAFKDSTPSWLLAAALILLHRSLHCRRRTTECEARSSDDNVERLRHR